MGDEPDGEAEKEEADKEEGEDEGDEGEEGGEEEEEAEDNSAIEIYFQPKYQDAENIIKIMTNLEIITVIMHEKMFDQLRTKE